MTKESLEASLRALDVWLIVFGVLVAIGVAGESVFGFLHWRRSNELSSIQNAENLALREKAADAERDAAEAKRTASEAGEGTAKALAQAGAANERAGSLEVNAETLRQENLKLSLSVEEERKARLELERALAPRQLLGNERVRLLSALRSAPMPHVIELIAVNFPEPQRFANILDDIFREAGWTIAGHSAGIFGDPPVGLIISTDTAANQTAIAVQKAFTAIGLAAPAQVNAGRRLLQLTIGLKP